MNLLLLGLVVSLPFAHTFVKTKSGYLVKGWTGYIIIKMVQTAESSMRCKQKAKRNDTVVYNSSTVGVVTARWWD